MAEDDMRAPGAGATDRRRLLAALGLGGVGAVAGCGGDGDGGARSTTAGGTTAGPSSTTAGQSGSTTAGTSVGTADQGTPTDGGETTATASDEVLDRTFEVHVAPPGPGEAQYNPKNGNVVWKPGAAMTRFDLIRMSAVDKTWQPELMKSWNYRAGVLDATLFEDHYWAETDLEDDSPANVTADDWMQLYRIKNYFRPQPWPFIDSTEKTGEYSFRVRFKDIYRRDYILGKTLNKEALDNRHVFEPWMQKFEDASSGSEVENIQINLQQKKWYNPNPFINVPFKVTGTSETRWHCELRDGEDPPPRWADQINYRKLDFVVSGEPARSRTAFVAGNLAFAGSADGASGGITVVDADVPFETATVEMPIANGPGAYGFNVDKQPMKNVHFRRAFAYMLDRSKHKTRYMNVDQTITGLFTENQESVYLSDAVLDGCTDYGIDKPMKDAATEEMKAGGFERDSNGKWLYQHGQRAGSPMSFKIPCYPWQRRQMNNSTGFQEAMAGWGIDIQVHVVPQGQLWGQLGDGDYEIALGYWGGLNPTNAFTNAFYPNAAAAFAIWGFPGDVQGPPLGEPATPPGEDAAEPTETYEVAQLLGDLQLTRNDQRYREICDQLAWVYNQHVPHVPIGYEPGIFVLRTDTWDWPLPVDEHPFAWAGPPEQRIWNRGVLSAVPQ
ncbi:MAG: ABC transporter substrate-binding protein [Halobacteriaceae archaeon]